MNNYDIIELNCLNASYIPNQLINKLISLDPNEVNNSIDTKNNKFLYEKKILNIYNFINDSKNKFQLFDVNNKDKNLILSKERWLIDISMSNEFDDVHEIDYIEYKNKLIKIKEKQKLLIDEYNKIFLNFQENINKNSNIIYLKEIFKIIDFLKNLSSNKRNEILNYPNKNKINQFINKKDLTIFLKFLEKEKIKVKNINNFIKTIDDLIILLKEEELKADKLQNEFIKLCKDFRSNRNKIHWNNKVAINTKNNLKNYKYILKLFNLEYERINNLNENDNFKQNEIENNEFTKSLNGFCNLLFGLLTDKQLEEIFEKNDLDINWNLILNDYE